MDSGRNHSKYLEKKYINIIVKIVPIADFIKIYSLSFCGTFTFNPTFRETWLFNNPVIASIQPSTKVNKLLIQYLTPA